MKIAGQEVEIEQLKDNWAVALMSRGVIVKLSLSMWRGYVPLTREDLGIKFVDEEMVEFAKNHITLGSKKILPPEIVSQVNLVDSAARKTLKDHSFNTTWGRFVPFSAFHQWHELNEEHRRDFIDIIKGITAKYDEIVLDVKNSYRNMARDVWARLYPNDKNGPTLSFTEDFVNKIIDRIPERDELVRRFKYDVTYLSIPVPTMVQANLNKASDMELERKRKQEEAKIDREAKEKIAQEYINRKTELIDGFLEATVYSMRENIAELCDAVLTSVGQRADGSLTRFHIKRIDSLIKNVNVLNFYDDQEIKRLMADLRVEIDKFKGERDDDYIVSKLKKLVDVTTQELAPEDFNPTIQYLEL